MNNFAGDGNGYYGDIDLDDAQGIAITQGELECNLVIRGPGVNRLAGNYVIPHPQICHRFDLAPATIVEGNHTPAGPWELNRP